MSPAEVRVLSDGQIVEMLVSLHPSDEAVSWLASVISSDAAFEGVRELRRRFASGGELSAPRTPTGRMSSARSVGIQSERWRSFFWRRRIALSDVGGLMEPARCSGWASVIGSRGRAGLYALDDLACALGLHVDQLIDEVGTDDERARLAVCV